MPSIEASDQQKSDPVGLVRDDQDLPRQAITGVILAGGLARRMGEKDKGLLCLDGRPLVHQVLEALLPQVGSLIINANRNLDNYRALGYPVVADVLGGFLGPLAGIASAMQTAATLFVLSVPCDSPLIPDDLCARLYSALLAADADISVVHDGNRMQPVFALLRTQLLDDLVNYLGNGGRRLDTWYSMHGLALADFSDRPDVFFNINSPQELTALEIARRAED